MKHKKPANSFAKKSKYKDGLQICNRECKTSLIAKMLTPKNETVSSDRVLIERMIQLQLPLKGGDSNV